MASSGAEAEDGNEFSTDQIVVAVRVRPLNARERAATTRDVVVRMNGKQTVLLGNVSARDSLTFEERSKLGSHITDDRAFTFDFSMWSVDPADAHYVSQEHIYQKLGVGLLNNAFQGYNACIFAYGQTGSGKTHTMMGPANDAGLIPRICEELFARIAANKDPNLTYKVQFLVPCGTFASYVAHHLRPFYPLPTAVSMPGRMLLHGDLQRAGAGSAGHGREKDIAPRPRAQCSWALCGGPPGLCSQRVNQAGKKRKKEKKRKKRKKEKRKKRPFEFFCFVLHCAPMY
jgi:hypothetical protein